MNQEELITERLQAALLASGKPLDEVVREVNLLLSKDRTFHLTARDVRRTLDRCPPHDSVRLRAIIAVLGVSMGWIMTGQGKENWDDRLIRCLQDRARGVRGDRGISRAADGKRADSIRGAEAAREAQAQ